MTHYELTQLIDSEIRFRAEQLVREVMKILLSTTGLLLRQHYSGPAYASGSAYITVTIPYLRFNELTVGLHLFQ